MYIIMLDHISEKGMENLVLVRKPDTLGLSPPLIEYSIDFSILGYILVQNPVAVPIA